MNLLLNSKPWQRALFSLVFAAAIFFVVHISGAEWLFSALSGWIAFALSFLIMDWIIVNKRNVATIRKKAREDDGGATFVFFIVLLSSFASMVAVFMLITTQDDELKKSGFYLPLTIASMILAWTLLHTQYLFHYAHEYYDEDDNGKKEQIGGLDFPGDEDPDYMDFAYYSFCIGCTFQVSDVETTTRLLRKITFFHSIISFFMNTFVVALTINLVAGMSK